MSRPSNSAARRAQIADGLIRVLADGAFHSVSVTDIARAAGLKPGLVHYHFSSKDEVLPLAVERLTLRLATRVERRARGAVSAEARLFSLIDGWLALGAAGDASATGAPDDDAEAVRAWATIGAEAMFRPAVAALYREALGRAHRQLHDAAVAVVGAATAATVATLLMGFIEGALRMGAASADVIPPGAAAPLARRFVHAFVTSEGGGAAAAEATPPASKTTSTSTAASSRTGGTS